ncbi:MAG: ABC transporter permease, partial [Deltaproteobacteria bacterium]|nr:ABC transporter permease [Deltaproteobacteria bacterium]
MIALFRIAWVAIRELLYERVFYILLAFVGLSLGLGLLLGQMTYAEQYKLTVDFMLAGIELSMLLFSIFMGTSLFHRELNSGSISMLLSKPISRATFLLGKYLGQLFVQFGVIVFMTGITAVTCALYSDHPAYLPIFQCSALIFLEVGILTAVTYCFAVNAGAITTCAAAFCFFLVGHLKEPIEKNIGPVAREGWIWQFVNGLLPDLEIFNTKTLASYGHALS